MPYAGLVVDQIVVGVICAMLPRPALVAATPPYDVPWPPEVEALMEWCWSEEKGDRPSFDLVLERLEVSNALPGAASAAAGGTSATSLSSIGAVSPPSSPRDLRSATAASVAALSAAASSVASADDAACTDAAATPSSLQPSAPSSPRTPRSPGCLQVHIGHVRTARDVGGKPFAVSDPQGALHAQPHSSSRSSLYRQTVHRLHDFSLGGGEWPPVECPPTVS